MWKPRLPSSATQFASGILQNLVSAVIVSLAGGWAAGWYSAQVSGDLSSAVTRGVIVFGVILVAWNQLREMHEAALRAKRARRTPAEIEKQIWEWLKGFGFKLAQVPNAGCDFSLTAEMEGRPPALTIVKMSGTPWVLIVTNVAFEEIHRDVVHARAPMIMGDIGMALIQLGTVEQELQRDDAGRLALVQLRYLLPFDGNTTSLQLLTAMRAVQSAALLTAEMYNKVLASAGIKTASNPYVQPPIASPRNVKRPPKRSAS
jgi:hypothetical protein